MPKLSQQTLEKRFLCSYCGDTFRTRQGLSGHIQFKHKPGTSEEKSFRQMAIDAFKLKNHAELAGFNREEISQIAEIWSNWERIKGVLDNTGNIKSNNSDFKTYLIVSLSQMQANRKLLNELKKFLDLAIAGMLKIQNDTASIIFSKIKTL